MRLATWNINSARTRVARVIDFLDRHDVDVLAMQETKCRPDQFPTAQFEAAGYQVGVVGANQWNGVAIASRVGLSDIRDSFPGQPAYGDPAVVEPRAIGANCAGIDVWSLYVPHGRGLDHPHFAYKMDFYRNLGTYAAQRLAADEATKMALVGDFNVAPQDSDVWDMAQFEGSTHVSATERAAFTSLTEVGLQEVTKDLVDGYTYWDYQKLRFPRNQGMRIDFVFATPALAATIQGAIIDRDERRGKGASDHVPVIVDFANS